MRGLVAVGLLRRALLGLALWLRARLWLRLWPWFSPGRRLGTGLRTRLRSRLRTRLDPRLWLRPGLVVLWSNVLPDRRHRANRPSTGGLCAVTAGVTHRAAFAIVMALFAFDCSGRARRIGRGSAARRTSLKRFWRAPA